MAMGLRYSRKKRKLMENEGAKTNEKLHSTNTSGKNLTLEEVEKQKKKKKHSGVKLITAWWWSARKEKIRGRKSTEETLEREKKR